MKDIKIIQSSDVHSYMLSNDKNDHRGLLRFQNYINELRKQYDVLLIDTGDMFQGTDSFLSYYVNENIEEFNSHPIVDVLNELKYDVFTLGNHEFNYGFEYLQKSLSNFQGDIVVANIEGLENYLNIKPYKIITLDGVKIGVIGFTTAQVPQFEKKENIKGLKFISIIDAYQKYEKELQEKCDIIIVNYHGGFEYDLDTLTKEEEKITIENEAGRLINQYKSIDILFSGHQHREISQKINGTYITQPGINASKLSEVTISMLDDAFNISGQLISIEDENTNINVPSTIIDLQSKLNVYLNNVISASDGTLKIEDLFLARKNSHLFVDFLNQLQVDLTGADISAVNLFDTAVGFSKDITIKEVLENYPFPNVLEVLNITKKDLKEALEISASYFEIENNELVVSQKFLYPKKFHFQYDMFYGIYYEMDITKPVGSRITKLELPIGIDENNIKIALNSYRANNYSWFNMYKNKEVVYESQLTITEMLLNYLKETPIIKMDKISTFKVKY